MKFLLTLSILWIAFSTSFSASLDTTDHIDPQVVVAGDALSAKSDSQSVVEAVSSKPKPYNIRRRIPSEFRSLGISPANSVIGFEVQNPQNVVMRIECNEDGLTLYKG
ncbi:MAG: hypothetical protein Q8Q56_01860, partial [Alphaproteobacteria bacterium]|nr:hypothetical protein [Alphaproteobacteria bacterium]